MVAGLPVSSVVNVTYSIAPTATPTRNFGACLIIGASDVIDTNERIRLYYDIASLADDFGTTSPEYAAGVLFFGQSPQPSLVYVGRWAKTATAGRLYGAPFNSADQATAIASLKAITTGSMIVPINGTDRTVSGLDFSGIVTLNGAATIINTALSTYGTCTWNAVYSRFEIKSATTGATSTVGYAKAAGSGTNVSGILRLVDGVAYTPVDGIALETVEECIDTLADISNDWYMIGFADSSLTNTQHENIAAYIEASSVARLYGFTTSAAAVLDATSTTDIASIISGLGYQRTFMQYSTTSPYAIFSFMGRAATVDFTANNTTITLKFKQEPGVTAEVLTATQAATLKAKHCNVFVKYQNDTSILQEGVMANGYFFDEVHNADWFANAIQTAVWNRLYTSTTKIPQTDPGFHRLGGEVEAVGVQAVNNGMLAPGVWEGPAIGAVDTGDTLPKGYYVYVPPASSQSASARAARIAPSIQCAAIYAGAVHNVNVLVTLTR